MAKIPANDFLGIDIGRLGAPSKIELPKELQSAKAFGATSLEEINKRREQIRELKKEYNRKYATVNLSVGAGAAGSSILITVAKNKKIFVDSVSISGWSDNITTPTVGSRAGIEIYNSSGSAFASLVRLNFAGSPTAANAPAAQGGNQSLCMSFVNPIVLNEGETLRLAYSSELNGFVSATVTCWEEDIII